MSIASSLAPLTVLGLDGVAVPCGRFWATHAVAIVWIRHYG